MNQTGAGMNETGTQSEQDRFITLELSSIRNCPICDTQVRLDYEDSVANFCSEYGYVCDACGLQSSFAYGNYETRIEQFCWMDSDSRKRTPAERKQEYNEQNLVRTLYRKLWVHRQALTADEEHQLKQLEQTHRERYEQR